jgi:uncharacterized membrane protein
LEHSLRAGRAVFALGIGAMGVLTLARPDYNPVLMPLPTSLPGRAPLLAFSGAWLVVSAVAILLERRARTAALAIAALLSVGALLHIRPVLMNPGTPAWVIAFESVALAAAAWTLAGMLGRLPASVRVAARLAFGASLIAFGLFHFLYHGYIESVVPAWIPGHTFWTYGIGVALMAAGVAIPSRIGGRLAATLLAVMFGSWVFIVHSPRVVASPANADEWSSLIIALTCCGASWIMREHLGRLPVPEGHG